MRDCFRCSVEPSTIGATRRELLQSIAAAGLSSLAAPAFGRGFHGLAQSAPDSGMRVLSEFGPLDVADHTDLFAAALAPGNWTGLLLPPGTYRVSRPLHLVADHFTLAASGATIESSLSDTQPAIAVSGDNVSITGLRTVLTAGKTTAHHYAVRGQNCRIDGCTMEYSSDQNTPALYVRGGNGFSLTNSTKRGSNAFIGYLEASNVVIAYNRIFGIDGGDDAIALKAINQSSENIRITSNYVFRHASIVSIGSQVGRQKADNPAHALAVRSVLVENNVAEECSRIAYIKPGALKADFRDGLVEDVTFTENRLSDATGKAFEVGFDIRAGHGAIVRNVKGSNNTIVARASGDSSTGHKVGAMEIRAAGGGAEGRIQDIDVAIAFADPLHGAAHSAQAAGYPVENIVRIDPRGLDLDRIAIRVEGDGCSESGVIVLPGARDGSVVVEALKLENYNSAKLPAHGGVRTASNILVTSGQVELTGNGQAWVTDRGGSFVKQ